MPGRSGAGLFLALLLAACGPNAVPDSAGASSCAIPADLAPVSQPTPPDNIPDAATTGYVLALSWSPEFCRFRSDEPQNRGQCVDNRFGFILHGLWPQAGDGPHPRACALAPPVPLETMREHYCMMPSAYLLQHEWSAHGTCQWDSAEDYYETAAALWSRFRRPDLFVLSRQSSLTAGDVREAFMAANPQLSRQAIGVDLNNRGWLEEVFLCLDLQEAPRPCDDREYGAADEAPAAIWRGGRTER
jgi:ribonuclease T2|tara:strand:+ start:3894 stop:4628 length:735 start_codon:yes stop_codon:yes gene_type:complete